MVRHYHDYNSSQVSRKILTARRPCTLKLCMQQNLHPGGGQLQMRRSGVGFRTGAARRRPILTVKKTTSLQELRKSPRAGRQNHPEFLMMKAETCRTWTVWRAMVADLHQVVTKETQATMVQVLLRKTFQQILSDLMNLFFSSNSPESRELLIPERSPAGEQRALWTGMHRMWFRACVLLTCSTLREQGETVSSS